MLVSLKYLSVRKNNVVIHLRFLSLRPVSHLTAQCVQWEAICKASLFWVKY